MNVGREKPGGHAIGVVNLDSMPSQAALDEVKANPDILSVSLIDLPKPAPSPPGWRADRYSGRFQPRMRTRIEDHGGQRRGIARSSRRLRAR